MRRVLTIIFLIPLAGLCFGQQDTFYFGGIGGGTQDFSVLHPEWMRDSLGFNVYFTWDAGPDKVAALGDYFKMIPIMHTGDGVLQEDYLNYIKANWAKLEAEERAREIRFRKITGTEQGGFVYGPTANPGVEAVFLDSLWYQLDPNMGRYTYAIRVETSLDDLNSGDTLGFLKITGGGWWPDYIDRDTVAILPIVSDSFLTVQQPIIELNFGNISTPEYNYIRISTLQKRTLGIDYFKVSNQIGRQLVEEGRYVPGIALYALNNYQSSNVLWWYLRDEPRWTHWEPMKIVKEALAGVGGGNSYFSNWLDESPRDFLFKVDPDYLWMDSYPLHGGQMWIRTTYCGGTTDVDTFSTCHTYYSGAWPPGGVPSSLWWVEGSGFHKGLQYSLNWIYTREIDTSFQAAQEHGKKLIITPTSFGFRHLDCSQYTDLPPFCDSIRYVGLEGWDCRPPTRAELSCITNMALCYGIKGIIYWRYDGYYSQAGICSEAGDMDGLTHYDPQGNFVRLPLWWEVKENFAPFIGAIDETYLTLDCLRAYPVRGDSLPKPAGAFIDSISAYSDSAAFNPDIGWFHVGEFSAPGSNDKYIMLVNRACCRDTLDPTPASPVTATVRLDPGNVGANHVFVVDVAHSDTFNQTTHHWDPVPESTYTSVMPDGTIPFTTTLRAGEGRLFKIVGTSEKVLQGSISTQYAYQGKIRIQDDATVPQGDTMRVVGPARLEVARCDSVQLIVNGRLEATGALADSVKFVSDTTASCDHGPHPLPGDWYGIRFGTNSSGRLRFCLIEHGFRGIEMGEDSDVNLAHCYITSNSSEGIHVQEAALQVDSSRIQSNPDYGIYSYKGEARVDSCHFRWNTNYGVKCYLTPPAGLDSTIITNCVFDNGGLGDIPLNSQYGILTNLDKMRIEHCNIREYYQGGMKLDDSDCRVRYADMSSTGSYGIYAVNYSHPYIRRCKFYNVSTGVKTDVYSLPHIGRVSSPPRDTGFCDFEACINYYFYHIWPPKVMQMIYWAEGNYFGEDGPDARKVHGTVDYIPWLWNDPFPKMAIQIERPYVFELKNAYPNPFNPATNIAFTLEAPGYVVLKVFNILGQEVTTLVDEYLSGGQHIAVWDGRDRSGVPVASGVYFYTIQSADKFSSKKMLMLR